MAQVPSEAKRRMGIALAGLLIVLSAAAWVVLMNHPRIQYAPRGILLPYLVCGGAYCCRYYEG